MYKNNAKITKGSKNTTKSSFQEVKEMMPTCKKEARKSMKEDGNNPYAKQSPNKSSAKEKGYGKMGMHKPDVVIIKNK